MYKRQVQKSTRKSILFFSINSSRLPSLLVSSSTRAIFGEKTHAHIYVSFTHNTSCIQGISTETIPPATSKPRILTTKSIHQYLRDDEVVDVEELADLLHREVRFHASVHELLGRPGVRVSAARRQVKPKKKVQKAAATTRKSYFLL